MKLKRPRLVATGVAIAVAATLAVAYYGWTLRCACGGCHCGWGCKCPKYWVPTMTEMLTIVTIVGLATVVGWRVLRSRSQQIAA